MRILIACLACLLYGTLASGQEVIYSAYDKVDPRSNTFGVAGKLGGRLLTYRTSDEGCMLDLYDDSMARLATVLLDFMPKKVYEIQFVAYPTRLAVLYQGVEGNKLTQYAALLDESGRLLRRPVTLQQVNTGFFGPNRDYFSSVVSDDKKTIVVYSSGNKSRTFGASAIWLDDSLNVRARGKATLDHNMENVDDAVVDNQGNAYFLLTSDPGERLAERMTLAVLPKGGKNFEEIPFPLGEANAGYHAAKWDNARQRLYVAGYFAPKKNGNIDGLCSGYLERGATSFTEVQFTSLRENSRASGGETMPKRALNEWPIRNIIVKKDGGFVVVSENYYVSLRPTSYYPGIYPYSSQTSSSREYHYNDLSNISFDSTGHLEWLSFVRKEQYTIDDGGLYSGFTLVNTGGALGFLFNGAGDPSSRIQLASMDGVGHVSQRTLPSKSEDPVWIIRSAKQVASREVVVPCFKKKTICFAKIVF